MKTSIKRLLLLLVFAVQFSFLYSASGFYDPNIGRWVNRDPIGERGGIDLYRFVGNDPTDYVDEFGLRYGNPVPPCAPYPDCINRPPPPSGPNPRPFSKSKCQDNFDTMYLNCSTRCATACVLAGLIGGIPGCLLCFGNCNAQCALIWTLGQGLCQLCPNP